MEKKSLILFVFTLSILIPNVFAAYEFRNADPHPLTGNVQGVYNWNGTYYNDGKKAYIHEDGFYHLVFANYDTDPNPLNHFSIWSDK